MVKKLFERFRKKNYKSKSKRVQCWKKNKRKGNNSFNSCVANKDIIIQN